MHRCIWGEPFPEHADFATEVEAHEFALRVSRDEGCEVAVIEIGGEGLGPGVGQNGPETGLGAIQAPGAVRRDVARGKR